jgi:sulfur carrier protein
MIEPMDTATPLPPPGAAIAITLNGTPCSVSAGTPLAELLRQHPDTAALAPEAIASAVNGAFVARARREQQLLQAGDAVTVFQAIVGG